MFLSIFKNDLDKMKDITNCTLECDFKSVMSLATLLRDNLNHDAFMKSKCFSFCLNESFTYTMNL